MEHVDIERYAEKEAYAGICDEDVSSISGYDIKNMTNEEIEKIVCDSIIFYDM